jgi:hypothetical protein
MSLYQYHHPQCFPNTSDAILSCVMPPPAKFCAGTIIISIHFSYDKNIFIL